MKHIITVVIDFGVAHVTSPCNLEFLYIMVERKMVDIE